MKKKVILALVFLFFFAGIFVVADSYVYTGASFWNSSYFNGVQNESSSFVHLEIDDTSLLYSNLTAYYPFDGDFYSSGKVGRGMESYMYHF